MFKSTKKRQGNRLTFQEQLNQKLNLLKQQTPAQKASKTKEIITILDEVVNELQTPEQNTPQKQHYKQINQYQALAICQNSSISLNSKVQHEDVTQNNRKKKEHISILVSNTQVVKFLVQNYGNYREGEKINLQQFIKKAFPYYLGIHLREQELALLGTKLKVELTTTDPQYLSLNALQIVAKKTNLVHYFQSAYISLKIQQNTVELQKKNKRIIQQLSQKQQLLKQRQFRLNYNEQQYQSKSTSLMSKQKIYNQKLKEFNLRQKQLKKNIEEKTIKLYQSYLAQFGEKIKETEKRLVSTQKNLKYKIEILQRRAQALRVLLNEKNDLKNKKIMNQNQARVRLRKVQKEMEHLQKKHQAQIELFQKQEKDLMKSVAILQQKLSKSEKKCGKYKQKIGQFEQQLLLANQQIQKMTQQYSQLQAKIHQNEEQPKMENQIKIIKQKTNRSSKNKKKHKSYQSYNIISLYQIVLQSINSSHLTSHSQFQQIINKMMKTTIKQVPQLIYLLTSFEEQLNLYRQPHFLVLNIAKTIINQFYFLKNTQEDTSYSNSKGKLKSTDIQQLLKYPYNTQSRFSIFLLFLQIYDWNESSSAKFFSKTIQIIVQQVQRKSILNENSLKEHQVRLFSSPQFTYFIVNCFYKEFNNRLQYIQKDSSTLSNYLFIVIAISDLLICLVKVGQESVFDKLSGNGVEKVIFQTLLLILQNLLQVYSSFQKSKGKVIPNKLIFESIQPLQELAQKLSIFIQRYYYKYPKSLTQIPQKQRLLSLTSTLKQLNKINGNRHSLLLANLKSVLQMSTQSH